MNTRTPLYAIALLALMFLASCATAPETDGTDLPIEGRTAISDDVDECSRIKYMCIQGMEPWSDETGCGCQPVEVPPCAATLCKFGSTCVEGKGCVPSTEFTECPAERQQACTKEYMPVCGKSVLNVGDTVFATYGNKCTACAEMKVVGYTVGACSDAVVGRSYKSTDVDQCAAIRFVCGEGQQYFGDDTGCGCEAKTPEVPSCAATTCLEGSSCVEGVGCVRPVTDYKALCPDVQKQNPHAIGDCGDYYGVYTDFDRMKEAPLGTGTIYYEKSTGKRYNYAPSLGPDAEDNAFIESLNLTCKKIYACPYTPYTSCSDPRPEACTMDYNPVCADKDNGIRCIQAPCPSTDKVTYGNGCSACGDKAVYGYVPGECSTTAAPATGGKEAAPGAIWCEKMDPEGPCTMDYTPVCGNDGKTYGNACGACRAQNQYYVPGECGA